MSLYGVRYGHGVLWYAPLALIYIFCIGSFLLMNRLLLFFVYYIHWGNQIIFIYFDICTCVKAWALYIKCSRWHYIENVFFCYEIIFSRYLGTSMRRIIEWLQEWKELSFYYCCFFFAVISGHRRYIVAPNSRNKADSSGSIYEEYHSDWYLVILHKQKHFYHFKTHILNFQWECKIVAIFLLLKKLTHFVPFGPSMCTDCGSIS